MTDDWTLTDAQRDIWRSRLDALLKDSASNYDALLAEAGLKETFKGDLSRFFRGDPKILKRWLARNPGKFGEPVGAALKQSNAGLLRLLRAVQNESVDHSAPWHPAFPEVKPVSALVKPPWYGDSLKQLAQRKVPVGVVGGAGSGVTSLVAWLKHHGQVEAQEHQGYRGPVEVRTAPWDWRTLRALATRLAEAEGVAPERRRRLSDFADQLLAEPGWGTLATTPHRAIELLDAMSRSAQPTLAELRDRAYATQWRRWLGTSAGPWLQALSADGLEDLLLRAWHDGPTDQLGWVSTLSRALPPAPSAPGLLNLVDAVMDGKGPTRRESLDALKRTFAGLAPHTALSHLRSLSLLEEAHGGLTLSAEPLVMGRVARSILRQQSAGWLRCASEPVAARQLSTELALLGLPWSQLAAELDALPARRWMLRLQATLAFACYTPQPGAIPIDLVAATQRDGLWLALAGIPGTIGGHAQSALELLEHSNRPDWWRDNLISLSNRYAGRLPRLGEAATLAERVSPQAMRAVEVWRTEEPARDPLRLEQALIHLAPAQRIPVAGERLSAHRLTPELSHSWRLAARGGDAAAVHLLAMRGDREFLGRANPDRDTLERFVRDLVGDLTTPPPESAVQVLRRFPPAMVDEVITARWRLDEVRRVGDPLDVGWVALGEALGNVALLRRFVDPRRRAPLDQLSQEVARGPKDEHDRQLRWVDRIQPALEGAWQAALAARQALARLGEPELLRAWALESAELPMPPTVSRLTAIRRGASFVQSARQWERLADDLPNEPQAHRIWEGLRASSSAGWVSAPPCLRGLVAVAVSEGSVDVVCRLLASADVGVEYSLPTAWWDALGPFRDMPAQVDGPRAVIGLLLRTWTALHTTRHGALLDWLAARGAEGPDLPVLRLPPDIRKAAIDQLLNDADSALLQHYVDHEGRHGCEVCSAVERRIDDLRNVLLERPLPPSLRRQLTPWHPTLPDYRAALDGPISRCRAVALEHAEAPSCRPLLKRLLDDAVDRNDVAEQVYWMLWLGQPVAPLFETWLPLVDSTRPHYCRHEERLLVGWSPLVKALETEASTAHLWRLVHWAEAQPPADSDHRSRDALAVPGALKDHRESLPNAARDSLLAIAGHTDILDWGPAFMARHYALGRWAKIAPLDQVFEVLTQTPPLKPSHHRPELVERLLSAGYQPALDWIATQVGSGDLEEDWVPLHHGLRFAPDQTLRALRDRYPDGQVPPWLLREVGMHIENPRVRALADDWLAALTVPFA